MVHKGGQSELLPLHISVATLPLDKNHGATHHFGFRVRPKPLGPLPHLREVDSEWARLLTVGLDMPPWSIVASGCPVEVEDLVAEALPPDHGPTLF